MTGAPFFRWALVKSVIDEKRAEHFVLPRRPR